MIKVPDTTPKKLGELLVESGLVNDWQLQLGFRIQRDSGSHLGEALVEGSFITEDELLVALSGQLQVPHIRLFEKGPIRLKYPGLDTTVVLGDPTALEAMPASIARRHGVFPLTLRKVWHGYELLVATTKPTDFDLSDELSSVLQLKVRTVLATQSDIANAIECFYGDDDDNTSARLYRPNFSRSGRNQRGKAHVNA